MAKDILKFHAIYWPAILLAIGEKPPDTLFIHGYFTVNGQKMSKTLRNALDPHVMVDQFGPDGARYLLLTQFEFGQDGDLKADQFVRQFNADLANDLGNLVSRTITLANRHLPGKSLTFSKTSKLIVELIAHDKVVSEAVSQYKSGVEQLSPSTAIGAALKLIREINRWFDGDKPWKLAESGDLTGLEIVLGRSAEATRVAAVMLSPVIPGKSREILRALGFSDPDAELSFEKLQSWGNRPIGPFSLDGPIFPRLDKVDVKATEKKPVNETATVAENVVTIDQFRQTKLRTAEVLTAEKVEGADKLLKLQVAVGDERRQIVAGIALHYKPEELVGKTIVIVGNLQPSKIRGVESQGMLLAASNGTTLKLLTTDGVIESGSSVG
jgi:methionyl-tRNA synthetase